MSIFTKNNIIKNGKHCFGFKGTKKWKINYVLVKGANAPINN